MNGDTGPLSHFFPPLNILAQGTAIARKRTSDLAALIVNAVSGVFSLSFSACRCWNLINSAL